MESHVPHLPDAIVAGSTEEMLAALPPSLVLQDGAAEARRLGEVLALYRAVFLNSTEAIAIVDTAGRYVEQNLAHQMLLGYTAGELAGMSPAIHMGEDAFAQVAAELSRVGACRREITSRTKDGRDRIIDLSAFTVRDRSGAPVCFVGIKRDVTEQRRAEADLRRSFAELQVMYRIAESLGRARAPEEMYGEAIDALLGLFGADRAAVLVCDSAGVMRFQAWRGLSDAYRAAVEGHSPWPRDARDPQPVCIPDARADASLETLRPVLDAEGVRALAFVPLVDDTTLLGKFMVYFDQPHQWTDAEMQLAGTIARHVSFAIARHRRDSEIREANRAKSDFLATMSHELRTPLNAIAGYTDLLDAGVHGELSGRQADALQRIQINQRHLLRLIDDVLDFAKLEAGHLHLEIEDVPVRETLESASALIETQLASKGIRFDLDAGDAGITCRGDRAKVQQVIANLLSNAWKFTARGGCVRLSWDASPSAVRIHVSDTGIGIDAGHIESAFEPFVQLNSGFRGRPEGTGLGLAISRELARAMGGDVTATSQPGKGSTFTLTLPR
ncbi:MAG TPA: ATP-binding protein [Gemmatimonadaceae bacterium]|nr:ATP-binding protein [Gemmatimonadaceae bacterium]